MNSSGVMAQWILKTVNFGPPWPYNNVQTHLLGFLILVDICPPSYGLLPNNHTITLDGFQVMNSDTQSLCNYNLLYNLLWRGILLTTTHHHRLGLYWLFRNNSGSGIRGYWRSSYHRSANHRSTICRRSGKHLGTHADFLPPSLIFCNEHFLLLKQLNNADHDG